MRTQSKLVEKMLKDRLEEILLAGNFPEVEFEKDDQGTRFMVMEYCEINNKLSSCLHAKLKALGLPKGIFENKRSEQFQRCVRLELKNITPEMVKVQPKNLRGMFD